jgi:hypothetical protein
MLVAAPRCLTSKLPRHAPQILTSPSLAPKLVENDTFPGSTSWRSPEIPATAAPDGTVGSSHLFPQILLFAPRLQPNSGQTRAHVFPYGKWMAVRKWTPVNFAPRGPTCYRTHQFFRSPQIPYRA